MGIDKKLKELQIIQLEKPNSILSMYLNTDPSDPEQQGGGWKIQLKNGLNSFENYLEQSNDKEELQNFKKVRQKVESFVFENQLNTQKSIVLFASADDSVWFAEHLQMNVKTEFHWQENAVTDQLYQLQTRFPRLGVVLVQQSQVKIINAELGTVLETRQYQLDIDSEDWVSKASSNKSMTSVDTEELNEHEQFSQNQNRWYKRLAPKLDKLAKKHNWERIYLVGDKEEARDIEYYMNKKVDKLEDKNILDHKESKILESVVA